MLTIETDIPINCSTIALPIRNQTILEIHEVNKQLLLVLLEKHKKPTELENESDDTSNELKMLQHKVDLLTTWLGKLLSHHLTLPHIHPVKISSKGIIITTQTKYLMGDTLQIECYIEPNFPQALLFQGQVMSVNEIESGNEVSIQFINLGSEVGDLLDKLIFQNHRRLVAYSRSQEIQ